MEIGQLCNLNSEDLRKWYYTSNPICNFTENSEDNLNNEANTEFDGNQTKCVNTTFEEYIQSHNHESMCSNYFMGKLANLYNHSYRFCFLWHLILIF